MGSTPSAALRTGPRTQQRWVVQAQQLAACLGAHYEQYQLVEYNLVAAGLAKAAQHGQRVAKSGLTRAEAPTTTANLACQNHYSMQQQIDFLEECFVEAFG